MAHDDRRREPDNNPLDPDVPEAAIPGYVRNLVRNLLNEDWSSRGDVEFARAVHAVRDELRRLAPFATTQNLSLLLGRVDGELEVLFGGLSASHRALTEIEGMATAAAYAMGITEGPGRVTAMRDALERGLAVVHSASNAAGLLGDHLIREEEWFTPGGLHGTYAFLGRVLEEGLSRDVDDETRSASLLHALRQEIIERKRAGADTTLLELFEYTLQASGDASAEVGSALVRLGSWVA